jgi:hypothetical protein
MEIEEAEVVGEKLVEAVAEADAEEVGVEVEAEVVNMVPLPHQGY